LSPETQARGQLVSLFQSIRQSSGYQLSLFLYVVASGRIDGSLDKIRTLEGAMGKPETNCPVCAAGSNGRCNTIWYKAVFKGGVYETREAVWAFGGAELQKDYVHARALCDESLSMFREAGDKTGMAWALSQQGDVARNEGDCAAARSLYEQSLAAFRELADRWGTAGSLADLGNLACHEGNYRAADSFYRESVGVFQALGHKRGIARLLECFAWSAALQSEPERSLRLAGAASALRQSIGAPLTPTEQAKLERSLETARQKLTTAASGMAWQGGWSTPVEKAIAEVLKPSTASSENTR
jgi:Tetratricopeptide repeat